MTQNIYDNETFFQGYQALRMADSGLNGALEQPALLGLLPDLTGLHLLDLGCGLGHFARLARAQGAASVTAVDISTRMLAEAARLTDDSGIAWVNASIESFSPLPQTFDLVVSSLAFHYVQDYASAVARIYQGLKPGGLLVFSVEHPMCTAHPVGWVRNNRGECQHWPVDNYGVEGARDTTWFVAGVIKYHRTIESYVTTLLRTGFHLLHMGEPVPGAEALALRPSLKNECRRPPFLLLAASRHGS